MREEGGGGGGEMTNFILNKGGVTILRVFKTGVHVSISHNIAVTTTFTNQNFLGDISYILNSTLDNFSGKDLIMV